MDDVDSRSSTNGRRTQAFAARLELDFIACFRDGLRCRSVCRRQNKTLFCKPKTHAFDFMSGDGLGSEQFGTTREAKRWFHRRPTCHTMVSSICFRGRGVLWQDCLAQVKPGVIPEEGQPQLKLAIVTLAGLHLLALRMKLRISNLPISA